MHCPIGKIKIRPITRRSICPFHHDYDVDCSIPLCDVNRDITIDIHGWGKPLLKFFFLVCLHWEKYVPCFVLVVFVLIFIYLVWYHGTSSIKICNVTHLHTPRYKKLFRIKLLYMSFKDITNEQNILHKSIFNQKHWN